MTIIAAIAAGNALAWLIHLTTWWLRRKCLWLMVLTGVLCFLYVVLSTLMVLVITDANIGNTQTPTQLAREELLIYLIVASCAVVFMFLGWLHALQLSKVRRRSAKLWLAATLCVFAEAGLALWLGERGSAVMSRDRRFWLVADWFVWSLTVTLLLLALLHPLVVRVGKLLLETVRESFRWSHTPT